MLTKKEREELSMLLEKENKHVPLSSEQLEDMSIDVDGIHHKHSLSQLATLNNAWNDIYSIAYKVAKINERLIAEVLYLRETCQNCNPTERKEE